MKQDSDKTQVLFRKFSNGDIIALFPEDGYYQGQKNEQTVMSYQHIGQHGAADYTWCIQSTLPAREREYRALYNELTSIGYNLDVRKRRSVSK